MDITETIRTFCQTHKLILPGEKILLAVSGGPDSVALAHIIRTLRDDVDIEISIAHINHGLRGDDSDEDECFVRRMACDLGFDFYAEHVDVLGERRKGESIEEAARRLRYLALKKILTTTGYSRIATGHTLDDNVETIIYRLISGTGPGGFVGIRPESNRIIHPLLCVSKEDVLSYLCANHLPYRIDRTNISTDIIRNKIRLHLVPLLSEINPRFKQHLLNFIKILFEENDLLDMILDGEMKNLLLEKKSNRCSLDYSAFIKLAPPLRRRAILKILKYLFPEKDGGERVYLPFRVVENMAKPILKGGNKTLLSNNFLLVRKEYDSLVFTKRLVDTIDKKYLYIVKSFSEPLRINEIGKELYFSFSHRVRSFEGSKLYLDFGRIKEPLIIRSRREGDRIELFGVGTKKVKELLIDHKVPEELREKVPVLECDGQVIGIFCSIYGKDNRVAEGYMVTERTDSVLICELRNVTTSIFNQNV